MAKTLNIPKLKYEDSGNFLLIAGPCAIEGEEMAFEIATQLKEIANPLQIPLVFKGSYKKANRTRKDSFTGIGDEKALKILKKIGEELDLPVTTDIHLPEEAVMAAQSVDILQIPAFLCRQTDLLLAAAETGKMVNIKKGQFMSPESMRFAAEKVANHEGNNVLLTERGTTFGYNELVVDFRSIPTMQSFGYPVILDCTHSLQKPNQTDGITGGKPGLIKTIAKAGVAVGADGLFIETHPDPKLAGSDGANMLPLNNLEELLISLLKIRSSIQ